MKRGHSQSMLCLFGDERDLSHVPALVSESTHPAMVASPEETPSDPDGADFPASMLRIRSTVIRNKLARAFGVQDHLRAIHNGMTWEKERSAAEKACRVGTGAGLSRHLDSIGMKHWGTMP